MTKVQGGVEYWLLRVSPISQFSPLNFSLLYYHLLMNNLVLSSIALSVPLVVPLPSCCFLYPCLANDPSILCGNDTPLDCNYTLVGCSLRRWATTVRLSRLRWLSDWTKVAAALNSFSKVQ
jgi:hypothetical protein